MANNQLNRRFSLVLLLFLISAALCGALWMRAQADEPDVTPIYVSPSGSENSSGKDWNNTKTLEDALSAASDGGGIIYCASGDYNVPPVSDTGTSDRPSWCFRINHSNIKLYGGYTGNISSPDEKGGVSQLIGSGDCVIKVMRDTDGIVIDGFTITSGDAQGDAQQYTNYPGCGGGIYIENAAVSVRNCVITGNHASANGGGIYNSGSLDVTSCTFTNNKADSESNNSQGGAIYTDSRGSLYVTNSTFILNAANGKFGCGGAIYINSRASSSRIINSTFSMNSANGEGGGIYDASGTAKIINTILWNNTAPIGSEINSPYGVHPDVQYCVISGDYPQGTNIISADPHLQWHTAGYYALPVGSSAIDAGISSGDWGLAPSDDVRGVRRPQGSAYDIGAYEYKPFGMAPVLSQTSLSLKVGSLAWLAATSAASETFTWSSDNEGVATVSAAASAALTAGRSAAGVTGPAVKVRAVGAGDAVITVTGSVSGLSSTCTVHVSTNGRVEVVVPPAVAQKISEDQGEVLIHFGIEKGPGGVSIPGYQTITGIPVADLLAVAPVKPTDLPP